MMRSRNQVARGAVPAVSLPVNCGESIGVSRIGEVLVEEGEGRALARGAVDGGKADGCWSHRDLTYDENCTIL